MAVRKQDGAKWDFNGSGTVNGTSAVSARLTLEAFNLADRNPELAQSDSNRRENYRKIFQQIWTPAS
jgi:3-hydroxyacyl-[acyl-carrier-protein] dehydratase